MTVRSVEFAILVLYMLSMIGMGTFFLKRSTNSTEEYFIAGRQIGAWVNGFALLAVLMSAATLLGFAGLAYKLGTAFALAGTGYGAIAGYCLAQMLCVGPLQRSKKFSVSDFLETRFNSKLLRVVTAGIIIVLFTIFIIPQIKGAGLVGSFVMGVPYWKAVLIVTGVFLFYVSIGGMWAVSWTDFIQGLIMVVVIVLLSIAILVHFGGFSNFFESVKSVNPLFFSVNPKLSKLSYLGFLLGGMLFPVSAPYIIARSLSARTTRAARWSVLIAIISGALLNVGALFFLPAAGAALFPNLPDPDMMFLKVVEMLFPPVLVGLAMAALFAAMMSTVDGVLLSISVAFTHDIIGRLKPDINERVKIKIAIATIWIVGVFSMLVSFNPPAIIGVISGWVVLGTSCSFFFPLVLGIWWKRANKYGTLAGIVLGFASYATLSVLKVLPMFAESLVAVPVSLLGVVLVSLATEPPGTEEIAFYNEMHSLN